MYDLYIANKNYSSWSLRPWVLMKALSIPFEERKHAFPDGAAGETFRKFSPSGKVPCLHDGDLVVWDSLAITEYLAESHPQVWPSEVHARAWARCAAAEMHSGFGALRDNCSMSCGHRVKLHEIAPALDRDISRLGELWAEGLTRFGGPFLAGSSFTAVDAFFAPVAFRIQSYGLVLPEPAAGYARHLLAVPAMQEWYRDALAETWREPSHDREIANNGAVTEDLRAV
ncbi:MAG: glutathione S-transferase family protein [Kofleriaceae bacterium]